MCGVHFTLDEVTEDLIEDELELGEAADEGCREPVLVEEGEVVRLERGGLFVFVSLELDEERAGAAEEEVIGPAGGAVGAFGLELDVENMERFCILYGRLFDGAFPAAQRPPFLTL